MTLADLKGLIERHEEHMARSQNYQASDWVKNLKKKIAELEEEGVDSLLSNEKDEILSLCRNEESDLSFDESLFLSIRFKLQYQRILERQDDRSWTNLGIFYYGVEKQEKFFLQLLSKWAEKILKDGIEIAQTLKFSDTYSSVKDLLIKFNRNNLLTEYIFIKIITSHKHELEPLHDPTVFTVFQLLKNRSQLTPTIVRQVFENAQQKEYIDNLRILQDKELMPSLLTNTPCSWLADVQQVKTRVANKQHEFDKQYGLTVISPALTLRRR